MGLQLASMKYLVGVWNKMSANTERQLWPTLTKPRYINQPTCLNYTHINPREIHSKLQ